MEGVTVLNQYINDTVFWIMLAIFGIGIAGILTRYTYNSKHSDILFYFFIGLILLGLFGSIISVPMVSTYYEVSVSDEVCLNDFMNKYEIVKQKGQIYIVKKRPQKDTTKKEITTTEVK